MKRLEAIEASPLGYAKRGELYSTARQTFAHKNGVLAPCLWPGGLAGTDDWEPVFPEVETESFREAQVVPPPSEGISEGSSQLITPVEVTSPEAGVEESGKAPDGGAVALVAAPTPPVVPLGRDSPRHRSQPRS